MYVSLLGFSCGNWASLIVSHGSRVYMGSVVVARGFSGPRHVGSWFPDQGSNIYALHWKGDS